MSLENPGLGEPTNRNQKRLGLSQETKGKGLLSQLTKISVTELPELPTLDQDLDDLGAKLEENGKTFSQLLEESQKGVKFQEGEVVEGLVVSTNRDYVTIDIGYKSEGQISAQEFFDTRGELTIAAGDHILVYIERVEDDEGRLILSKEKADVLRAWDEISEACEKDELVEGVVVSKVKGGLSVDIGVKAFLPGSQVDIRPTKNLDQYLGKTYKFKIIKFNKKRGNIVLSRRMSLRILPTTVPLSTWVVLMGCFISPICRGAVLSILQSYLKSLIRSRLKFLNMMKKKNVSAWATNKCCQIPGILWNSVTPWVFALAVKLLA